MGPCKFTGVCMRVRVRACTCMHALECAYASLHIGIVGNYPFLCLRQNCHSGMNCYFVSLCPAGEER